MEERESIKLISEILNKVFSLRVIKKKLTKNNCPNFFWYLCSIFIVSDKLVF